MPKTTSLDMAAASRMQNLRGRHGLLLIFLGGLIATIFSGCDLTPSGSARPVHTRETSAMPTPVPNEQASPPPIDRAVAPATATATFALGWFWGPDARFGSLEGVIRTRVGYAGGVQPDPTYRRLADHTETIQIDFDPTRLGYEELLTIFWQAHNPTARRSRQYQSIIFYHDNAQQHLAMLARDREAARRRALVHTEIRPYHRFYRAEAYHQKYQLRREKDILQELQKIYPENRDVTDSTAAARINGYLGGFGTSERLVSQMDQLGLSPEGRRRLRELYDWRQR